MSAQPTTTETTASPESNSAGYILPKIKPLNIGDVVVDPPILQTPMAGFTNYAFRQIVREYGGSGLIATEMVNARGFVWLDEHDAEHPDRLWGVREEARPLAVQIWDSAKEFYGVVETWFPTDED